MLFIVVYLLYAFACYFGYFFRKRPYKAYSLKNRALSSLGLFLIGVFLTVGLMSAVMNYSRSDFLFNLAYTIPAAIISYGIAGITVFPFFFVKLGTKKSKGIDFFMQFLLLITVLVFIVFVLMTIVSGSIATKILIR